MTQALDIQQVIKTSTSDVSIDDLNKKGFKQVKVLNQTLITRLISEAVDRVLEDKSREITRGERDKVIKEARSQFETLAKSRLQKERGKIDDLEKENASLSGEVETAKKRQAALMESQAERDQALVRVKAVEIELAQLKAKLTEQETLLSRQEGELSKKEEELQRLRVARSSEDAQLQQKLSESEARAADAQKKEQEAARELASAQQRVAKLGGLDHQRDEEAARLKATLSETEKNFAVLEGQLQAKNEELERMAASAQQGSSNAGSEQVLAALTARLEEMGKPSDANQIMLSLDSLSKKLSNMSSGQGAGGGGGGQGVNLATLFERAGEGAIESNISKVKVKQAKTGDVRGALAKLRKLQKGGEDGE